MRKLLSSNLYRLRKDAAFYVILLFSALTGSALVIMDARYLNGASFLSSGIEIALCGAFPWAQLLCGVAISLYLGKEYDWGGLRQKLSCGIQRHHVYLANQLTATVISSVTLVCYLLAIAGTGSFFYNGSVWSFGQFLYVILCSFCINAVYAAIYTAISMNIPSRTISLISSIGTYFVCHYLARFIDQRLRQEKYLAEFLGFSSTGEILLGAEYPNPDYIGGAARKVLVFLNNFLPSGQALEMEYLSNNSDWTAGYDFLFCQYWPICSLVLLGIVSALGYRLFRKKDIK